MQPILLIVSVINNDHPVVFLQPILLIVPVINNDHPVYAAYCLNMPVISNDHIVVLGCSIWLGSECSWSVAGQGAGLHVPRLVLQHRELHPDCQWSRLMTDWLC